MKPKKN
jgi:hypothetical protein